MNFLRCLALQEKKNLMTARVSMLLKSRASHDMLPFSLCNKKRLAIRHMNRPLFPTTLSIPSYDREVGRLRTYQHPFIESKISQKLLKSYEHCGQKFTYSYDRKLSLHGFPLNHNRLPPNIAFMGEVWKLRQKFFQTLK